ncbi:hypothetical protein L6R53_25050 [Myxococcota bacterium]|nr:hypothetical protein [Myxococcota bacterium]
MIPVLLLVGALGGCACRRGRDAGVAESLPPAPPPTLSGAVSDGVFTDARLGFRLPVGEGWTAEPGRDDGLLRVTLVHAATRTRVEIWAFEGGATTLRPRGDCAWDFVDTARYRSIGRAGPVTTGTCTPTEAALGPIYGWLVPSGGSTLQAEIHVPPAALVDGRREGERLVSGLRPAGELP